MERSSTALVAAVGVDTRKVVQTFAALISSPAEPPITRADLIGTKPAWEMYTSELAGPTGLLAKVAHAHHVRLPTLRFHLLLDRQGFEPLEDVRTTDEFMAAWYQVFLIVRALITESHCVLGCFSGARKALSQALVLAFQLLARPQDRIVQVVAAQGNQASPECAASPTGDRSHSHVAEMPFLRVQDLPCSGEALKTSNLLAAIQPRRHHRREPTIEFQVDRNHRVVSVAVNGRNLWPNRLGIRLRRRDLALWLHLAELRRGHGSATQAASRASFRANSFPVATSSLQCTQLSSLASTQLQALAADRLAVRSISHPRSLPCQCCFREATELSAFVPEQDRDLPEEYVRQAMSRIKRALIEFGLSLSDLEAVRFRGAGVRPNTAYGLHMDPSRIIIRQVSP